MSHPSPLEILLEWGEPFTHHDYPVDNYTVMETDLISRQTSRRTSYARNYTKTTTIIASECKNIKFAVLATSAIGSSDSATITSGFPIGKVR